MKTKRGETREGNYFTYELNGKEYLVQGELYYNKKNHAMSTYIQALGVEKH